MAAISARVKFAVLLFLCCGITSLAQDASMYLEEDLEPPPPPDHEITFLWPHNQTVIFSDSLAAMTLRVSAKSTKADCELVVYVDDDEVKTHKLTFSEVTYTVTLAQLDVGAYSVRVIIRAYVDGAETILHEAGTLFGVTIADSRPQGMSQCVEPFHEDKKTMMIYTPLNATLFSPASRNVSRVAVGVYINGDTITDESSLMIYVDDMMVLTPKPEQFYQALLSSPPPGRHVVRAEYSQPGKATLMSCAEFNVADAPELPTKKLPSRPWVGYGGPIDVKPFVDMEAPVAVKLVWPSPDTLVNIQSTSQTEFIVEFVITGAFTLGVHGTAVILLDGEEVARGNSTVLTIITEKTGPVTFLVQLLDKNGFIVAEDEPQPMEIGQKESLYKLAGAVRFHQLPQPLLGTGPSEFNTVTVCLFASDWGRAQVAEMLNQLRDDGLLSAVNETLVLSGPVGYGNFFSIPSLLPRTRVFGDRVIYSYGRALAACSFASPSPHVLVIEPPVRMAPGWREALRSAVETMQSSKSIIARVQEQTRSDTDSCDDAGAGATAGGANVYASSMAGGVASDLCKCWALSAVKHGSDQPKSATFPSSQCKFDVSSILIDAEQYSRRLAPTSAMATRKTDEGPVLADIMNEHCNWGARNISVVMPSRPVVVRSHLE